MNKKTLYASLVLLCFMLGAFFLSLVMYQSVQERIAAHQYDEYYPLEVRMFFVYIVITVAIIMSYILTRIFNVSEEGEECSEVDYIPAKFLPIASVVGGHYAPKPKAEFQAQNPIRRNRRKILGRSRRAGKREVEKGMRQGAGNHAGQEVSFV